MAASRTLDLRVGSAEDALDRFEAAWNRIAEKRPVPQLDVLTFPNLPLLLKTLTPARWALLEALGREKAGSVYELAKRLGRDYKNVHTDVAALATLGLVAKDETRVSVPWQAVRAELRLTTR